MNISFVQELLWEIHYFYKKWLVPALCKDLYLKYMILAKNELGLICKMSPWYVWIMYYPKNLIGLKRQKSFLLCSCWFNTVVFIWEKTKPHLWSKLSLFKTFWQMLKALPQVSTLVLYLPHLRAFKWGTVWPYTSKGIKNTTG